MSEDLPLSLDEVFSTLGEMGMLPSQLSTESLAEAWVLSRTYLDDRGMPCHFPRPNEGPLCRECYEEERNK